MIFGLSSVVSTSIPTMKKCDLIKLDALLNRAFELVDTNATSNNTIRQRFCYKSKNLVNLKGSYIYLDMDSSALNSSIDTLDDVVVYTKFEDDEPIRADTFEEVAQHISEWVYGYQSYAHEAKVLVIEMLSHLIE